MNIQDWHVKNSYKEFEVGDYVQIDPGLTDGAEYHGVGICKEMEYFRGQVSMIVDIDEDGDIKLKGDNEDFYWPKQVLFLSRKEDMKLNSRPLVGDKVFIGRNLKSLDESHLPCYIIDRMLEHAGELATITEVIVNEDYPERSLYRIDRDDGEFGWPKEAFRERVWE